MRFRYRAEVRIPLRITVLLQARMDVSPTSLSMGDVTVGSARDTAFAVHNAGNALLTGGIRSRNEAFKVFPDTIALQPGQSRSIRFAKQFGKKKADADFDARFDLNRDGEVGFPDFLTFAKSFGK